MTKKTFSTFLFSSILIIIFSCSFDLYDDEEFQSSSSDSLAGETNYQNIINFHEFVFYDNKLKISIERETANLVEIQALLTLKFNDRVTDITNFKTSLNDPIQINEIVINKVADEVEIKNIYLNNRKYSVSKTFPITVDFNEKKQTVVNTLSSNQVVIYKFFSNNVINNINDVLITEWLATNVTFITNYQDISITEKTTIDKKVDFTNFITVNYIDKSGQNVYNDLFSNYYEKTYYFTNNSLNHKNDIFHYQYQATNVGTVSNIAGMNNNIAITKGIVINRVLYWTNQLTYNVFPVYLTNEFSNYYEKRTIYDGVVLQKADITKTNIVFNQQQIKKQTMASGDILQTNTFRYNRNIFHTNEISLKRISGSIAYSAMVVDSSAGGSGNVDKSDIVPSDAQNSSYSYALKNGSAVFPAGVSVHASSGQITVAANSSKSSNTYTITATVSDDEYAGVVEGEVSINITKTSYDVEYVGLVTGFGNSFDLIFTKDGNYAYAGGSTLRSYSRSSSDGMLTLKQNLGNAGSPFLSKNEDYLYTKDGGSFRKYSKANDGSLTYQKSISFDAFTDITNFYADGDLLYVDGITNSKRQLFVLKADSSGDYSLQQVVSRALDSYINDDGLTVTNFFGGVWYQWQIDEESDSFYMTSSTNILHYNIADNGDLSFKAKHSYSSYTPYRFTFNEDLLFYLSYRYSYDSYRTYYQIIFAHQKNSNGDLVYKNVYSENRSDDVFDAIRNRLVLSPNGNYLYYSEYDNDSNVSEAISLYYTSADASLSHVKDYSLGYTQDIKYFADGDFLLACGGYGNDFFKVYSVGSSGLLTLKKDFDNTNDRLEDADRIIISEDSKNIYVLGDGRVAVFEVEVVVE